MVQEHALLFRALPSVDTLLSEEAVSHLVQQHGHSLVVRACRETLDQARDQIRRIGTTPEALVQRVQARVRTLTSSTLVQVINGTGVVIHTNLGRAPLSAAALAAMAEVGAGYSNLEYDIERGLRGSRHDHVTALLADLSGAEAAMVVNNNAAALLLALAALASEREVVISRAHLVEIGGGFRIPDIMRQSGALLREVGTTNRTYLTDFTRAVNAQSALFLRVHSSNFRIEGFVHHPTLAELTSAAHEAGLLVLDDVGSGALLDTSPYGVTREPMVQESVQLGADLVLFSGDKLLGGPQAGCIVGRSDIIDQLRQHPLARAVRVDKLTLAALEATLRAYQSGRATEEIPVWRMMARESAELEAAAWSLAASLNGEDMMADVREGLSTVGGGALPGETLPSWVVALPSAHPDQWAQALRAHRPAVIARIADDHLLLDPRTILPEQEELVLEALRATYSAGK